MFYPVRIAPLDIWALFECMSFKSQKKKKTLTFWVYLNLLGIPRSAVFPQDTGYSAFKANLC